jgi:hypothetical protein
MATSDKTVLMRAFNTLFFDFVNDIISIFPEDKDIPVAKTSFEWFKKANPTSILKAWHFFVYSPYIDVINEGNIDFFFEKDYKSDLTYLSNANEVMSIIDKLRNPIKLMSKENKDHSMKYIQNLSTLSNTYMTL